MPADAPVPSSLGHQQNQGSFSMSNMKEAPSNHYHGNHSFRCDNLAAGPSCNMDPKSQKLWELSVNNLQSQPWYADGRPESDNASASSGEVSNADSGRGPSEEGENSLMNTSLSAHNQGMRRLPPQVAHGNHTSLSPNRHGNKPSGAHHHSYQEPAPSQYVTFLASERDTRTKRSNSHPGKKNNNSQAPVHGRQAKRTNQAKHGAKPKVDNYSSHPQLNNQAGPSRHATSQPQDIYHSQKSLGSERWDHQSDTYGDNGSSTSGSYILDSKDLDSDHPPFSSVVV